VRSRSPRVTGIQARHLRVAGRNRAARITFMLSRPGRVLFVVRGPAPSCQVAGRFTVRGDRGVNHVRFTGRVGRRELPSGTYRVSAKTRGGASSRPVVVAIGERRVTNRFACGAGATTDPFNAFFATYGSGSTGTASETSSPSGVAGVRKTRKKGGVIPAVGQSLRKVPEALPELVLRSPGSPSRIFGFGAVFLLFTSGLALVLYIRSLWRSSR
jgi:hypothetical protein